MTNNSIPIDDFSYPFLNTIYDQTYLSNKYNLFKKQFTVLLKETTKEVFYYKVLVHIQ